ncbi:MAG: glycosyltransferase family 2 protein [Planctomycetes bacterium]|nr:glycosyltransferase family 2 protein [Planctomycetota bacterium]
MPAETADPRPVPRPAPPRAERAAISLSPATGSPGQPRLSIVVVCYGMVERFARCADSLAHLEEPQAPEVVVVDNGPDGACASIARRALPGAVVILPGENLGFSRAANRGWRRAAGDNVLFLNPDAALPPRGLTALVGRLAREARVGAIAVRHLLPGGAEQATTVRFPALWRALLRRALPRGFRPLFTDAARPDRGRGERFVDWAHGSFLLLARRTLLHLGGFDERYFIGGEDLDLCWRLQRAGLRVLFTPEYAIRHDAAETWKDPAGERVRGALATFFSLHRPVAAAALRAVGLLPR